MANRWQLTHSTQRVAARRRALSPDTSDDFTGVSGTVTARRDCDRPHRGVERTTGPAFSRLTALPASSSAARFGIGAASSMRMVQVIPHSPCSAPRTILAERTGRSPNDQSLVLAPSELDVVQRAPDRKRARGVRRSSHDPCDEPLRPSQSSGRFRPGVRKWSGPSRAHPRGHGPETCTVRGRSRMTQQTAHAGSESVSPSRLFVSKRCVWVAD